ncbi:SDR family oxidoreductase [Rhodoferax sp.]|uniref:UDP-glucose 4-epimerase family protein n=1 Tax=Rhodoferax sp. TaxID=50421 RepID=UPI002ACE741F|nr:SDR family oxidoreductase [Rhodoferax sp.]MDZ7922010.1 SDR family oxidoreductase [Rhodoferax sp.]
MNVLLTGASGFVGSALLRKLVATGRGVRACYRTLPPTSPEGVACYAIPDFTSDSAWRAALVGTEVLVHAAARVHVMDEKAADPLKEFRRINVGGTLALARWAAAAGVRRFVFISSVKALGERTYPGVPFSADTLPEPEDAYGISKWEAEQGLQQLSRETDMEVVIIRPPLVYGPGVRANFASMMRWLSRGFPLPLGAVTHNRRSFVALDNLVDLITVCTQHHAAANQIFLAGDGEDLSTAELLRRMGHALDVPVRLPAVPLAFLEAGAHLMRKKDTYHRLCNSLQVDIRKTRYLLGWTPPLTMDEGLRLTAQEFRK